MTGHALTFLAALAAAGPALASAGVALAADDAAPVQGTAAWQKLVGNTVVATTKAGGRYTDYYGSDGSVRHQDGDGATTGQWSQDGDKVCFDYPDDDERVCDAVAVTGATGTYTDPDGQQDSFDILPGNAKGL